MNRYQFKGMVLVALFAILLTPALLSGQTIEWNTFVGGYYDAGQATFVDANGNTYIAGMSWGGWGAPVRSFAGTVDILVAKVDPNGVLLWHTFLGGPANDQGYGVCADTSGNVYVTGFCSATWGSPIRPFAEATDSFVAKLDANGVLQWHTFLGGAEDDWGHGIAVDMNGKVYVVGESGATWATPVRPYSGDMDAFVAVLNGTGVLEWNTFLGSTWGDMGFAIDVDTTGNIFVAGHSQLTWGSPIRPFNTVYDVFVAKVASTGGLVWNTFLGGSAWDKGYGIALDTTGNIYVAGQSYGTWGSPVNAFGGGTDGFAAKLNSEGSLQWNSFVGGAGQEIVNGVAIDTSGNIYIAGESDATWGSPARAYGGGLDGFAAKLNGAGGLQWNTFVGGANNDSGKAVALDTDGDIYVVGESHASWGSPVRAFAGTFDAFAVKLSSTAPRVDFNKDGQEDILWRYYGTGGYNRAWYLGNTEGAGSALTMGTTSVPSADPVGLQPGIKGKGKAALNQRAIGALSDRMTGPSLKGTRNPMGAAYVQSRLNVVDDPRKAGGVLSDPSQMSISDPRQVKLGLDVTSNADVKLASTPSVLGGGDVMPVGDLNWQIVGTGDFNNDTHVDILWRYNGAGGTNVVWYMDGVNWTGSAVLLPVSDLNWKIVGTGDFNNDTHVDILWRNGATGVNVVWYMDGTEWTSSAVLLGVSDPNWQIVGTGDFNKDGSVDILWRYGGSGGYDVIWYMNGVNWNSSAELIHVADTTWQIVGTGDYNNDGSVDILWRYNGAGGWNVIWYMNGVNWVESAELIPVGDLNWKIVSR